MNYDSHFAPLDLSKNYFEIILTQTFNIPPKYMKYYDANSTLKF